MLLIKALNFISTNNDFKEFLKVRNLPSNPQASQIQSKLFEMNNKVFVYITFDFRLIGNPADDIMCLMEYSLSNDAFMIIKLERLIN
jgi:hypothetical protein